MEYPLYLGNDDFEVIVDVYYRATYQPARVSGPPEDCYPDESELSITGFDVVGVRDLLDEPNFVMPSAEELQDAFEHNERAIWVACWEDFHRGY